MATPLGIDPARHRDLHGRELHPWGRRAALSILAVIPILGLFGTFGQCSRADVAGGRTASLTVVSPPHLRGGLIFTTQLVIQAEQQLADARLLLAPEWFQGMTFNGIAPQPGSQSSRDGWVSFDYGRVDAGRRFAVWISWQVDPTNIGRHQVDVILADGPRDLVREHRVITVFP